MTALGESGMDQTECAPAELYPGVPFTSVKMRGKLYADTLEGIVCVAVRPAVLTALDPTGKPLGEVPGRRTESGMEFTLDGSLPAVDFLLKLKE